jgi:carbon catabolite-derepressing protein kinase
MLVVDPIRRITIAEIRNLEWFNIGLPEYLQPVPLELMDHPEPVDKAIVEDLSKVSDFRLCEICDVSDFPLSLS